MSKGKLMGRIGNLYDYLNFYKKAKRLFYFLSHDNVMLFSPKN